MLNKLLIEIRSGGTLEARALASHLGTTPQLVELMLEHLQNAGHIQRYQSCDSGCGDCGLKTDCQRPQQLKIWQARQ